MILDDKTPERPNISYPTEWGFKLIGRDQEALKASIKEIMGEREHLCVQGNVSKTGKFHSYNTRCLVASEEERASIFKAFQKHQAVKIVI